MAKNTRSKKGQVSLASAAGANRKSKKKKKKATVGVIVVRVLVAVLTTLSVLFIAVMGYGVYSSMNSGGNKHDVQLYSYDTTPEAQEKKVSYFLVGLTDSDESAAMDMLTLICYDKAQKNVRFLQVPTDTYIGQTGAYTVTRIGNVWNNPTPLVWCETCRKRVFEPEQKDGKHTTCETPLTEKTGSAVESLISVFNDQFSMPVDNYFILSPDTLKELVNAVGGINVELDKKMTVSGIEYPVGNQLLDGSAALYYATDYEFDNSPAKDTDRLLRQRKVWAALLQRMSTLDENTLLKNVIQPIMAGANPLRTNTGSAAVAKMMAGVSSESTENMTYAEALSKLLKHFGAVDLQDVSFHILPGNVAKQGSANYFSIKKDAAVKLLQEKFNPYGLTMTEEHLLINEIATAAGETDTKEQTMKQIAVEQSAVTITSGTTTATSATEAAQ